MKRTFPTIILMLALVGCDKAERTDQTQTPPAADQPGLSPTPTPTPAPVAPTPPPPPMPRLAPDGVFYVIQRVDITTDSGVIGLKPGTQVKLVRKSDTSMIVTDGKDEFTVSPQVLTNDLDVAARIAQANAAAAAAAAAASTAASTAPPPSVDLNKVQAALNDLQSRRQVLQAEESRILKQIDAANDAQTRYSIAKSKGTPIQLEPIAAQLPTLRARLQKVREDIGALK